MPTNDINKCKQITVMKKAIFNLVNFLIKLLPKHLKEQVSDGFHTYSELYESRLAYNAALFNLWAEKGLYDVHKSFFHNNHERCFGGGWFIVSAMLPQGQISNHYPSKYWDLFKVKDEVISSHKFDGHDTKDVFMRITEECCKPRVLKLNASTETIRLSRINTISTYVLQKSAYYEKIFKLNIFQSNDLVILKNKNTEPFTGVIKYIIEEKDKWTIGYCRLDIEAQQNDFLELIK